MLALLVQSRKLILRQQFYKKRNIYIKKKTTNDNNNWRVYGHRKYIFEKGQTLCFNICKYALVFLDKEILNTTAEAHRGWREKKKGRKKEEEAGSQNILSTFFTIFYPKDGDKSDVYLLNYQCGSLDEYDWVGLGAGGWKIDCRGGGRLWRIREERYEGRAIASLRFFSWQCVYMFSDQIKIFTVNDFFWMH